MRGDWSPHGPVQSLTEFFPRGLSLPVKLIEVDFILSHSGSANVEHASVIEQFIFVIEGEDMTGETVFVPAGSGVVPKETGFSSGAFSVEQSRCKADSVDSFLSGNLGFAQLG